MDLELIRLELELISMAIAGAVAVYAWVVGRSRATNARIDTALAEIDNRADGLDQRVTRVEAAIEHGPTRADIGRVHSRLDEVSGAVARIEGESHGMARNIDLIHQHLLERHG